MVSRVGEGSTPSVFQVPPDDRDHVELGAIGRQVKRDDLMFEQPTLTRRVASRRVADTVMNAGIVLHYHRGQTVRGGGHTVDEALDMALSR